MTKINLDTIREMNLQVGTPIEIIRKNGKYKEIGYFVDSERKNGVMRYTLSQKVNNPITKSSEIEYELELRSMFEIDIEDIRILEYKK
jgi:hypothetical protein